MLVILIRMQQINNLIHKHLINTSFQEHSLRHLLTLIARMSLIVVLRVFIEAIAHQIIPKNLKFIFPFFWILDYVEYVFNCSGQNSSFHACLAFKGEGFAAFGGTEK